MTNPSALRTTCDLAALQALFSVFSRLSADAPDLVVARGSFAVFAYAPTFARIPNDLDLYWRGDSDAVLPLLERLGEQPEFSVVQIHLVTFADETIVSLHRGDVLVWLRDGKGPTHRTWVDISTTRDAARSVVVDVELEPDTTYRTRVVPLAEVLAEKLFTFLDAISGERSALRWTALFDMMVLLRGAGSAIGALQPQHLRDECMRFFTAHGVDMPTILPEAPVAWRSPWYQQVGPVARAVPNPTRACEIARAFWRPVIDPHRGDGDPRLRWDTAQLQWIVHT